MSSKHTIIVPMTYYYAQKKEYPLIWGNYLYIRTCQQLYYQDAIWRASANKEVIVTRFLLFDSGCTICATLADDIEQMANGWLTTRSLHEPELQQILNMVQPQWRWRPMILERQGEKWLVYAGPRLAIRLLQGLGLAKSVNILKLITTSASSPTTAHTSRRLFLKGTVATALLPVAVLPKRTQAQAASWVIHAEYVSEEAARVLIQEVQLRLEVEPVHLPVPPSFDHAVVTRRFLASGMTELAVHAPVGAVGFVIYNVYEQDTKHGESISRVLYYEHVGGDASAGANLIYGGAVPLAETCACGPVEREFCSSCTTNPNSRRFEIRICCTCPLICGAPTFVGPCGMC